MKVGIFGIGDLAANYLQRLTYSLEERFLYPFSIEPELALPASAFNSVKKQYFAPALMSQLKSAFPGDAKYALGITEVDLYGISLNYVFGDANPDDRVAVASVYRLRPEFYGHAPDDRLLSDRLLKETMHQLSHAQGLNHCYNQTCVMFYANNIYDIDQKSFLFCLDCEKKLKKTAALDRNAQT